MTHTQRYKRMSHEAQALVLSGAIGLLRHLLQITCVCGHDRMQHGPSDNYCWHRSHYTAAFLCDCAGFTPYTAAPAHLATL